MELATANFAPTDQFKLKFISLTLSDFESEYGDELQGKDLRNAYDNRLRPRNLILYYMMDLLEPTTRTIGTQTTTRIKNKMCKV